MRERLGLPGGGSLLACVVAVFALFAPSARERMEFAFRGFMLAVRAVLIALSVQGAPERQGRLLVLYALYLKRFFAHKRFAFQKLAVGTVLFAHSVPGRPQRQEIVFRGGMPGSRISSWRLMSLSLLFLSQARVSVSCVVGVAVVGWCSCRERANPDFSRRRFSPLPLARSAR